MAYLSKRSQQINPSSTLSITARAKKMRQEHIDVVSFAAGEPDFDTPDQIKQAAIDAIKSGFTKYTPSSGIFELKSAIQKKFRLDNNLNYDIDQIVVSNGAKHSLFNLMQALIAEGDEVIVPSPYWVSYVEMVKFCGGVPAIVKTNKSCSFKLDGDSLKKSITKKTKALILNSPSNPVGYTYARNELEDIAEVCIKNKLFVISDEIYEKLIYENGRHISIASINDDIYKRTFVVNGVSKAYSMTGWRIGYMAGDKTAVEAISKIQDHSTSNPCSISQKAALAALSLDSSVVDVMRKEFESRRDYMLVLLDEAGMEYIKPQGAFYVFCDISKTGLNSFDFSSRFLTEKHVASIPGSAFGDDGYVRFSFATSKEQIEKGIKRLREFLDLLI
ncbi:MAG: aspartate aminotransferase [Candidatus Omnitrophica bacterium CG11_big_fil_rev_8_21_14_0_20_42_13]|uniref:Aminotransferase n=1 Tax=Candidatus Ghiorseimicrobium undicola TaxID=1974746 RepID=A0A2H0LV95_9BACT|nr:MAG: aspartate aminotransferase [Candidatus Omnitrophica bacterium CG11_big_fil_rev_8_21_14_0_20_42_13]